LQAATRGFDARVHSKIVYFGGNQMGCVKRCFRFALNLPLDFGRLTAIVRRTSDVWQP
jgi:hypothetical protein